MFNNAPIFVSYAFSQVADSIIINIKNNTEATATAGTIYLIIKSLMPNCMDKIIFAKSYIFCNALFQKRNIIYIYIHDAT
jgi:hypothetical protein